MHCQIKNFSQFTEHISPELLPIPRQINTVHTFHSIFPIANIIILSTIKLSNWPLPFRFSYQNFNALLSSPKHATCPTHITILTLDYPYITHYAGFSWLLLFLLSTIHKHPQSIFFPQQEILKFHTQNMNQAKLYFIHLRLDVSRRNTKQKWV